MEIAKETDLPDLLESLGYQVRRIGNYHTTKEMDSLRIKSRRTWFRYSEGVGGDAITFLQRFCGKSFPEAVEYLLAYHGRARDSPALQKPMSAKGQDRRNDEPLPPFALPPPNTDHRRVFAYGTVQGDIHIMGTAVVIDGEEIRNNTLDTLVINEKGRSIIRDPSRDELIPQQLEPQKEKCKKRGLER